MIVNHFNIRLKIGNISVWCVAATSPKFIRFKYGKLFTPFEFLIEKNHILLGLLLI